MTVGDQYPGQPHGPSHGGSVPPHSGGVYGAPGRQPGGSGRPSGRHGQPGQGPPPHGRPGQGPPPHGQPGHGPPRHGQPPQGQPQPGQPTYGGGHGQPGPHRQPPAPGFEGGQFAEPPGFGSPPPPPSGGSRFWLTTLAVFTTVVVLTVCGVGGYFVFRDDGVPAANQSPTASASGSKSTSPSASPSPTASPVDIRSRSTDPEPLTEKELFGRKKILVEDSNSGEDRVYKVVKTQEFDNCSKAATNALRTAVKRLGCNQVVRAAINSKDGKYGATAGVFNLKEKGHSKKVDPLVKKNKGTFTGLAGPGASAQINKASLALYWEERGHYLVYVMICRGSGRQIKLNQTVERMASDLLISHLATKLAERTGTVLN